MIISILNCDNKWGIGKKNGLLFSLPKDMEFFKNTTLNHVVCMGENTLLSFPKSKPLKNRTNIVLSKDETHNYEGVINVHDYQEFLRLIAKYGESQDVFIIGWASIYNQTLPYVDYVYLTKVEDDGGAEVFFTNLDTHPDFECVDEGTPIEDAGHIIRFTIYKNNNKQIVK